MQHALLLFFSFCCSFCMAQTNLVPNPSFEEYIVCPTETGHNLPNNWISFRASPDYYNSCADTSTGVSVPHNTAGFQYAADGNAYIGIVTAYFDEFGVGTNEYNLEIIGAKLVTQLVVGNRYFVSFKVNYANGWGINNNRPSNNIGVSFSTNSFSISTPKPLNNFAQVYADYVIQDSVNWTTISGSFVADSAYRYIMLGNFFDMKHTTVINPSNSFYNSYYLIDDVKLSSDSMFVNSIQNISSNADFLVYPNPASNFINIVFDDSKQHQVIVYNSIGEIALTSFVEKHNTINISALSQGIYYITANGNSIIKKFIIY